MTIQKVIYHWLKQLLKLLPFVALVFIIYRLTRFDIDYDNILTNKKLQLSILIVVIVAAASVYISSLNYRFILYKIAGHPIPGKKVSQVYITANLYKYLPGNVMHYLGRNSLARPLGIQHKDIAFSSLFEALGNLMVVTFLSLLLGFPQASRLYSVAILSLPWLKIVFPLFIFAMIILFILLFLKWQRFNQFIIYYFSGRTLPMWCIATVVFSINFFVIGTSFLLILRSFEGNITLQSSILIIIAYNIAWIAGFITPGAPGGIGVKEFVLVLLLGALISENTLLLAVVVHRISLIIADVGIFGFNRLFHKYTKTDSEYS